MALLDFLRGPAGPQGPPGPAGPQGPAGTPGTVVHAERIFIPNDATPEEKTVTFTAPTGQRFLFIPQAGATEIVRDANGHIQALKFSYSDGTAGPPQFLGGQDFDVAYYSL